MKEGQDKIYYASGEGKAAVEMSPAMEKMKKMEYEVLYMVDPLDEICASTIADFQGFKLVDVNKAGLELNKTDDEKEELEQKMKDFEPLATWLKTQLGDKVQKVQVSDRLVDSMAVLVQGEWGMSPMMQKYMKQQATASNQESAFSIGSMNQAILEVNPDHPVIADMKLLMESSPDDKSTKDKVMMIYETALLLGGYSIDDPNAFAKRVASMMEDQLSVSPPDGPVEAEVV
mmetsp:Transcript_12100/g.17386  ORF Transcript_12100/g.17386 Transcript_12100/m.17386 type:complete len:231 (-) Transcript_12100:79-771(-)